MDVFMVVTAVVLIAFLAFSMGLVSESQNKASKEEKEYREKLKKRHSKIQQDESDLI